MLFYLWFTLQHPINIYTHVFSFQLLRRSTIPFYGQLWRRIAGSDDSTNSSYPHHVSAASLDRRFTSSTGQHIPPSPATVIARSMDEALARVRRGELVLVTESTEALHHAARRPCDLLVSDQLLPAFNYTFMGNVGNRSLIDELDAALDRLRADGLVAALIRRWWNLDDCDRSTDVRPASDRKSVV